MQPQREVIVEKEVIVEEYNATEEEEQIIIKKELTEVIEEESSEEEAEPDFIEGVCDYHHCHGKTFMRCDYDLNDIIENKKSTRC